MESNKCYLNVDCDFQKITKTQCDSYTLILGIICGSIPQITPLLLDIFKLKELTYIENIELYLLANGESKSDIKRRINELVFDKSILIHIIEQERRPHQLLPIGQARSLLQMEVGKRMGNVEGSIAWIIDDDMRIPDIANAYLSWLPVLRQSKKADVLIGCFDGGSPNPPAHGLRVQINDLLHNLKWLATLNQSDFLPDRTKENKQFREKFPDYYYDLSRQHSKHITLPYWVVPRHETETVLEVRDRILKNLTKILTGEPFLRPLLSFIPKDPIKALKPSCNRGGNTFIFNPKALTSTPNSVLLSNGKENRRSDMIWAIVNRYYHLLNVYSVPFPIYHNRYINVNTKFQLEKTVAEVKGSSMYAALLSFFEEKTRDWVFTSSDYSIIIDRYNSYIDIRLEKYKENFRAVNLLLDELERVYASSYKELSSFIGITRPWVQESKLGQIKEACFSQSDAEIVDFINSLIKQNS